LDISGLSVSEAEERFANYLLENSFANR